MYYCFALNVTHCTFLSLEMIEKCQYLGMINVAYTLTLMFVGEKGDPGDIEQCECKSLFK